MKKVLMRRGFAVAAVAVMVIAQGCSSSSDDDGDYPADNPAVVQPSAVDGLGGAAGAGGSISGTTGGSVKSNAGVSIIKAQGWLESGYVTWADTAESYNVYYKSSDATEYTRLDAPLIRNYGSYVRADVLGLAAGDYDVKIHAVNDGTESSEYSEASISVASHDRSGFAFTGTTTPGAYKADGTLKENAVVIYLTDENKESVSLDVIVGNKNKTETKTGIIEILLGYKKGYETRPLAIRVVGTVSGWSTLTSTKDTKGDLVIENGNKTVGITMEGVGDDAVANEWGLRFKNANYCEARNIGFLNCSSDEGDNIGLQQDNNYIWVHNCDYFYGNAGSDKDQVKGDGALDCKKSNYVTFAYNHFWDNGKCNLLGLSEGTKSYENGAYYITYHHNWYDHSDSRHPRTRYYNAHVYNNYYDGNAKYGAGSTLGSSVFMESNYFRNCKNPMMTSMQGTDVYAGDTKRDPANLGTFSKEDGGVIKAYNNYMEGKYTFIPYGATSYVAKGAEVTASEQGIDTSADYDAYVVSNRSDTVPNTVVSYQGSNYYSNFDTASGFYAYSADEPAAAMENVKKYAGRVEGGDFTYTFNDSVEDTNYTVIDDLKSAVTNYKTTLTKVYGTKWVYDSSSGGNSEAGESGGTTTGENVAVTGVSLSKTALALKAGNNETITATIEPANATTQDVTWSSDNTGVAKVSDGKITAVDEGEATITVTTKDGNFTATCTVTVEAIHATDLTLSKTAVELTAGKTETITATLEPADATDSVTWSSGDKTIATVDKNGKITAVAEGTVKITAKAGTIEKTCTVTVTAAPADDLSGLVALAAGTYNLTKQKITVAGTDIAAVFSSQNAGVSQTKSGILITAKIDSKGANLSTKAVGTVYFKIDSEKTISFSDSETKGAALYAVNEDGTVSETAIANESTAPSYSYTLSAGTYAIKGTTSSSAKIASITVE